MKKYCASCCCLLAIGFAGWLLLYAAVQDMVSMAGFDWWNWKFYDFSQSVRLSLPMLLFIVAVWVYARIRRSMDKDEIRSIKAEMSELRRKYVESENERLKCSPR